MINFKFVNPPFVETQDALVEAMFKAQIPVIGHPKNRFAIAYEGKIYISDVAADFCLSNAKLVEFEDALKLIKQHTPQRTFDIKPFDRVLVRSRGGQCWRAALFSHVYSNIFVAATTNWEMLIKYEGNEELAGQTTSPKDGFWTAKEGETKWINS